MSISEVSLHIDNICVGDVYARNISMHTNFNEERFMASRSCDEFVIEDITTLSETETTINDYGLTGNGINLKEYGYDTIGSGFGIMYDGINALQTFDNDMMPHRYPNGHVIIFNGEYIGDNLQNDGDIVKPKQIIEIIKLSQDNNVMEQNE